MTIAALLQTITVQFLKDMCYNKSRTDDEDEISDVSSTGLLQLIKRANKSQLLDWVSRLIFPVVFTAFSVCHIGYYNSDPQKVDGAVCIDC